MDTESSDEYDEEYDEDYDAEEGDGEEKKVDESDPTE